MATRYPHPFWRKQTGCFYVQIGKKQYRLDPDRDEAYRLYHALMQEPQPAAAMPVASNGRLVVEVIDEFLEWAKTNSSPRTYVAAGKPGAVRQEHSA